MSMVRQSLHVAVVGLLLLVAACSPPPAEPPPRNPTVFDDQLKALDKAKALQKSMDAKAAEADKAVDDASR